MTKTPTPLVFTYTNWRGETSERRVIPETFRFAATDWHPEPQWLLVAWDIDKGARRDFAWKDIRFAAAPTAEEKPGLLEVLGKFGWHPDPVIDFEVEIERLESRFDCAKHGSCKPGEQPETIATVAEDIRRAMTFKAGGTVEGVIAKNRLRKLERAALSATPKPVAVDAITTASPLNDYHEDDGEVLWWVFPVAEAPYVGSPNCDNWPGYHTHWTRLPPTPAAPLVPAQSEARS